VVDFTLTDEQKDIREMAHDFAEKEIRPVAWEYDRDGTWPQDIIEKAWEIGLMNSHLPEEYGGPGLGFLDGALIGLSVAALLGVGFYDGSRRLNLATFFRWTGISLVFIAGGLVAKAIHELIEINVITVGNGTLFDLSAVLPHADDSGSVIGQVLHALFGYTATPEALTFALWLTYVTVVLVLFLRPVKRLVQPPAAAAPTPVKS